MVVFSRLVLLALAVCLLTACGCGRPDASHNNAVPIVLTFWNGFTGPDGTTMEKIVRKFNREHKDIRVKMQIIAWSTYYDKLTLGLAYGGAPDIFIVHANRFPEFANYGSLSCMDDLLAQGQMNPADFVAIPWKAGLWKGKRYGIPLDCHPQGLYYNAALFKKAGIVDSFGNPKPPSNLAEFLDAAHKLTVDEDGDGRPEQWGFAFTWLRTNAYTFYGQFGTGLLNKDLNRSDLSSERAVRALQLMSDFIYKYKIAPVPEGQDAWMGFQTGKVAMALEGIYMLSSLESQKGLHYLGAPCPVFGMRQAAWGNSHLLAIPSNSVGKRRAAAWEFVRYLSDHSLDWARGGQVPVRKSILASSGFAGLRIQKEFSRELPYVVLEPASVACNQIAPFADAAVEAALMRIKTPRQALNEAAWRIDNVMKRQ